MHARARSQASSSSRRSQAIHNCSDAADAMHAFCYTCTQYIPSPGGRDKRTYSQLTGVHRPGNHFFVLISSQLRSGSPKEYLERRKSSNFRSDFIKIQMAKARRAMLLPLPPGRDECMGPGIHFPVCLLQCNAMLKSMRIQLRKNMYSTEPLQFRCILVWYESRPIK